MVNPKKQLEQWGPIDAVVLYMSYWYWASGPGVKKHYGVSWPRMIAYFSQRRVTFWWEKEDMQKRGEIALKKYLLSESRLKQIQSEYTLLWKEFLSLEKEIASALKNKSDTKAISSLTKGLYDFMEDFWCVSLIFEESNYAAPDFLGKTLSLKMPEQTIAHALEILLAPVKPSFHQQEEKELLSKYLQSKNKKHLSQLLTKHAAKWFWVENSYYECKCITADDFQKRLDTLTKPEAKEKLKKIDNYFANTVHNKKLLAQKYNIDRKTLRLAQTLSFSIWWQDDRKAKIWRTLSAIENLAVITSKHFAIPLSDLMLYTAEEFTALPKTGKKLSSTQLQQRLQGTIFNINPKSYTIQEGKTAQKTVGPFIKPKKNPNAHSTTLTGIVVSKSKKPVRAPARILLSPRDGKAMQQGEILIAPMTSPDFVPYMRKASAIVTDIGGLMSHAAVISRELGIACVTNTKIATKIFKDGDIIEVDTNTGTIKKI